MRSLPWIVLLCLLLMGSLALAQNTMTCSSDNGQTNSCRVGNNNGIEFVRQRSQAACIEGQTYGIQRDGVWVSNGCRADFAVYQGDQYDQNGQYSNQGVYNDNGTYRRDNNNDNDADDQYGNNGNRRHHHHRRDNDDYNNGTYNNGTYNNNGTYDNGTYGPYNNNGQYSQQGTYGPYDQGTYDNGTPPQYRGSYKNGVTHCSAESDSAQTYCQTGGAFSALQITNQNGRCVQDQTWGVDHWGLWVAGGCSADFNVQR